MYALAVSQTVDVREIYALRKRHLSDVAEALDADFSVEDKPLYRPRFNVAPTDLAWIVVQAADRRVVRPPRWKYETAARRLLINTRSETVPMGRFGPIFAYQRCAVVTDGFYEWPDQGAEPVWFRTPDDGLVLLGGLLPQSKVTNTQRGFSGLTTRPYALIAQVHDCMPVIVTRRMVNSGAHRCPA